MNRYGTINIENGMNRDLILAQEESNMVVRPGEIHMNDDELKNGVDPSCLTEHDERDIKESYRTGMEE